MEILYVLCYPNSYFKELIKSFPKSSSQPAQKFNKLVVDGFKNNDVKISVLLTEDKIQENNKHSNLKWKKQIEDDICYYFMPFFKNKYISYILTPILINRFLKDLTKKTPDLVVVMDFLKPFSYQISKKANKLVSIITDLPEFLFIKTGNLINDKKIDMKLKRYNKTLENSTHFVFLTKQMNSKLNTNNKPYCIMEGLVDFNKADTDNILTVEKKNICLYSGALHRQFGIDKLISAFQMADIQNYELHIYGNGDYVKEIQDICSKTSKIKFFGIVDNDIVVEKQKQATVLINPRPTSEEFTLYSFPSKNMEYMSSGTPVITTNLPGMPKEYKQHVYIFEDESIKGMAKTMVEVLNFPKQDLYEKGLKAKQFVLNKKNNIVQTKKILDMINGQIGEKY